MNRKILLASGTSRKSYISIISTVGTNDIPGICKLKQRERYSTKSNRSAQHSVIPYNVRTYMLFEFCQKDLCFLSIVKSARNGEKLGFPLTSFPHPHFKLWA